MVTMMAVEELDNPPLEDDGDSLGHTQMATAFSFSSEESEEDESAQSPFDIGYAILTQEPQNDEMLQEDQDTDHEDDQETQRTSSTSEPEHDSVFNGNATVGNTIPLDDEKIQTIREAMAGFSLPMSAIPHWANVVPEEEWKDHLLALMNSKVCSTSAKGVVDS